jgi:UDPglucose 6-dehydrogenase
LKFKNSGLCVIFNPEFLTEVNALNDFRNQDRIVLGGPRPYINTVKSVFEFAFPKVRIVKTSSTTAEMVKYTTNIALAVKVALANELHQICQALDNQGLDIDYDKVIEYASIDTRLGTSHWKVPGPDGLGGFGGSCFPKDINALISVAQDLDIKPTMMLGAWYKNLEVRPERDWELLKGRAVS